MSSFALDRKSILASDPFARGTATSSAGVMERDRAVDGGYEERNDDPRATLDVAASTGRGDLQARRLALALASALAVTGFARIAHGAPPHADPQPAARDKASAPEDEDDDDDSPYTLGAEVDLNSRYLWRGLALSQGAVAQPSVWGSAYGLNAVLWTNVMLTNEAPKRLSAIIPAVSYTLEWKKLTIEPGLIYYDTPGQPVPPATAEATLETSLEVGRFAHLLATGYMDIGHAPGALYGTAGVDCAPKIGRWELRAVADLGWATAPFNQTYFDERVTAIDVAEIGGRAEYLLTDVLYVALHAEGSTLLASSLAAGREATLGNVGVAFGGEL
jgi:hypothetical protein